MIIHNINFDVEVSMKFSLNIILFHMILKFYMHIYIFLSWFSKKL